MSEDRQAFNPYLPLNEYIPDGEPHVFGNRIYLYGSHDRFRGAGFCLNDYVCYSADLNDLTEWKYEGVRKGELSEVQEKLDLKRGGELSDYVIKNSTDILRKFYFLIYLTLKNILFKKLQKLQSWLL